ncbi:MAG: hypothetical protein IT377_23180 [Polyangiaceae bacterium]|nr:hypothetical protein [Polyangiaceae bacterium]
MPSSEPTRVGPEHLALTGAIFSLLRALDDPLVGTAELERLVAAIPVLAARCIRKASRAPLPLGAALARMGNRGLEAVLLELLEDLTICKADADEGKRT